MVRRLRDHYVHRHAGWAFAGVVHAAHGDGHGGAAGEIGDGDGPRVLVSSSEGLPEWNEGYPGYWRRSSQTPKWVSSRVV
jgi:hypothetical protein